MGRITLTDRIQERARQLGFDLLGIAPALPPPGLETYSAWLERGYHGEMGFLARPDRVARCANPDLILPGVRSVVCVAASYYSINDEGPPAEHVDPAYGIIARYARLPDYHTVLLSNLRELARFIEGETGRQAHWHPYVDTGPVLERAYAAQAGLGFIGKNTCLIHPRWGSWLFLGELFTDMGFEPTPQPFRASCGRCQRCLDACPTGALVAPHWLDARRCISYLTIEHKGTIPLELRPRLQNRIFGCDICQEVCPWQRFARPASFPAVFTARGMRPLPPALSLLELIALDEASFRKRFAGTPLRRTGRARLLRNVTVALGNWGNEQALPGLISALQDTEPLIRGHAAWALGRLRLKAARAALDAARKREHDPNIITEIEMALE